MPPVGPSVYSAYPAGLGPAPRALTVREIHDLVVSFGEAARRAKEAGFDAVEIHCTHSYLIDQFMSPRFNHRTDIYGGSIENRARFACEIVTYVREKVGKDYPIICRMTGEEYVEGGITIEDAKVNAALLIKSGADCLSISVGFSDYVVPNPPMFFPEGCFLHLAESVKKSVSIPVIGVGRISNTMLAEQALREGKADLIAIGRALIADPYLPQKAKNGRFEEITPCIYCNQGCVDRVTKGLDITCLVNPAVGREKQFTTISAKKPRKVLVVGGGPAGLNAAIVAKKRGHDVVLAEKEERLGGQLNSASRPPKKEGIKRLIDYLSKQVSKLRIKTYISKRVNKEFVQEINPDVIVMATGSTFAIPSIPGIHRENVLSVTEILEGKKKVSGEKAIVVGGGQVGLETAEFLGADGKKVTVLEMSDEVGADLSLRTKGFLLKKLSEVNVQILLNRKVEEISNHGVRVDHFGQHEEFTGDAIVIATGLTPERTLLQELEEIIPEFEKFYIVGDCIEPRKALEAIYEGTRVGNEI
jgi:NADPH-dependent 2,4-dienoyl-CoA reductase/sulfur reductase-like enzyme